MNNSGEFQKFLTCSDGQEIFYWGYSPKNSKGTVVLVHGLGEHSGRYQHFAKYLVNHGWAIHLYDQRGHGKTPGIRSYVESFQDLISDLSMVLSRVEEDTGKKPFLMGHSFGGQVAINFLAKHSKMVAGAILSSPNIQLAMKVFWLKRVLGKYLSIVLPSLSVPNDIDPKLISHDPLVIENYKKDPLVQSRITLRLGDQLLENLDNVPALAKKIKCPVLIFHGSDDGVTCVKGSQEFYKNLKVKDKTLKIYPEFFHETLNEIGREEVYQDVLTWLDQHHGRKKKATA